MDLFIVRVWVWHWISAEENIFWIEYWFVLEQIRLENESGWFRRKLVISFLGGPREWSAAGVLLLTARIFTNSTAKRCAFFFLFEKVMRACLLYSTVALNGWRKSHRSRTLAVQHYWSWKPDFLAKRRQHRLSLFPFCWLWPFTTAGTDSQTFTNFTVHRASKKAAATTAAKYNALEMGNADENARVWCTTITIESSIENSRIRSLDFVAGTRKEVNNMLESIKIAAAHWDWRGVLMMSVPVKPSTMASDCSSVWSDARNERCVDRCCALHFIRRSKCR